MIKIKNILVIVVPPILILSFFLLIFLYDYLNKTQEIEKYIRFSKDINNKYSSSLEEENLQIPNLNLVEITNKDSVSIDLDQFLVDKDLYIFHKYAPVTINLLKHEFDTKNFYWYKFEDFEIQLSEYNNLKAEMTLDYSEFYNELYLSINFFTSDGRNLHIYLIDLKNKKYKKYQVKLNYFSSSVRSVDRDKNDKSIIYLTTYSSYYDYYVNVFRLEEENNLIEYMYTLKTYLPVDLKLLNAVYQVNPFQVVNENVIFTGLVDLSQSDEIKINYEEKLFDRLPHMYVVNGIFVYENYLNSLQDDENGFKTPKPKLLIKPDKNNDYILAFVKNNRIFAQEVNYSYKILGNLHQSQEKFSFDTNIFSQYVEKRLSGFANLGFLVDFTIKVNLVSFDINGNNKTYEDIKNYYDPDRLKDVEMNRTLCQKYSSYRLLFSDSNNSFSNSEDCLSIKFPKMNNYVYDLYKYNYAIVIMPENLYASSFEEIKKYSIVLLSLNDYSIKRTFYSFDVYGHFSSQQYYNNFDFSAYKFILVKK